MRGIRNPSGALAVCCYFVAAAAWVNGRSAVARDARRAPRWLAGHKLRSGAKGWWANQDQTGHYRPRQRRQVLAMASESAASSAIKHLSVLRPAIRNLGDTQNHDFATIRADWRRNPSVYYPDERR